MSVKSKNIGHVEYSCLSFVRSDEIVPFQVMKDSDGGYQSTLDWSISNKLNMIYFSKWRATRSYPYDYDSYRVSDEIIYFFNDSLNKKLYLIISLIISIYIIYDSNRSSWLPRWFLSLSLFVSLYHYNFYSILRKILNIRAMHTDIREQYRRRRMRQTIGKIKNSMSRLDQIFSEQNYVTHDSQKSHNFTSSWRGVLTEVRSQRTMNRNQISRLQDVVENLTRHDDDDISSVQNEDRLGSWSNHVTNSEDRAYEAPLWLRQALRERRRDTVEFHDLT